jgi:large subunit ribosomal protein L19
MFTVRKMVGDVAVERIFPVNSPSIEKVVVKAHSKKKIRQSKLYYLRTVGK